MQSSGHACTYLERDIDVPCLQLVSSIIVVVRLEPVLPAVDLGQGDVPVPLMLPGEVLWRFREEIRVQPAERRVKLGSGLKVK
jgi:hypothetical protein